MPSPPASPVSSSARLSNAAANQSNAAGSGTFHLTHDASVPKPDDDFQNKRQRRSPPAGAPVPVRLGTAAVFPPGHSVSPIKPEATHAATSRFFSSSVNLAETPTGKSREESIELTGKNLTTEQIVKIARYRALVTISKEGIENVQSGFNTVIAAARQGLTVYGLTNGVGQNKDKRVLEEGEDLSTEQRMAEMMVQSKKFNLRSIRAHTSGTGDPISPELVRAAMLIRLNTLLSGAGGVQPAVATALCDFLNRGITPLIPDCGSIGQADLVLMAHVGLTMVGEWYVLPEDQNHPRTVEDLEQLVDVGLDPQSHSCPTRIVPAQLALAKAALDPIELVGKDFLSIISNNSLTAGSVALGVHDAAQFIEREIEVFGLCLQGLNGVIAPFLEASTAKARPFPEPVAMAKAIRAAIHGSNLWASDAMRAMQDPLSYRTMHYRLGEVARGIKDTTEALQIQINSSDDNPFVDIDHQASPVFPTSEQQYLVNIGHGKRSAIVPTGNFDSNPFVKPMEQLLSGLSDLSTAMANHVLRFETPEITRKGRFLSPGDGHGFGAVSKGVVALNDAIVAAALPAKHTNLAVAGGQIEDLGNAGPVNAKKLHETIQKLYSMASYQLMYATQAIDLTGTTSVFSPATKGLYEQYRAKVPPFVEDRESTTALARGAQLLKNWPVQIRLCP